MMHQMTSCYFMPPPQDGNKIFPPPCRALLTCRCLTRFKMGSFSYFLSECGGFTSVQCLRFHEEKIISLLSLFRVIDGSLFCEFLLFNFSLSEVFKIWNIEHFFFFCCRCNRNCMIALFARSRTVAEIKDLSVLGAFEDLCQSGLAARLSDCIHADNVASTPSDEWVLLQHVINFFPTLLWAYWLLLHTVCRGEQWRWGPGSLQGG